MLPLKPDAHNPAFQCRDTRGVIEPEPGCCSRYCPSDRRKPVSRYVQATALFTDNLLFPSAVAAPYHICCEESLLSQSRIARQTPQWHTLAQDGPRIKNSSLDSAKPAPNPLWSARHGPGNTALRSKTSWAAALDLVCAQPSPKSKKLSQKSLPPPGGRLGWGWTPPGN